MNKQGMLHTCGECTSVVSRKGRRSQKATSWPGILPQPAGTAGLRRSLASAAASLVPGTPAQQPRPCVSL